MQQVDWQQGDGYCELVVNEEEFYYQYSGDFCQYQLSGLFLGEIVQGGDQQFEGKGVYNGVWQIEVDDFVVCVVGWQKVYGQNKGDDVERYVN